MYDQGKTRAIGVSNFCQKCFECLSSGNNTGDVVMPAVNQIQFHVGMGEDPQDILSFCEERGVQIQAYSPLGGTGKTELITGDLVTEIGKAHGVSGVQVALRWIWQLGVPLTTKTSSAKHLADDVNIFSWSLTNDEMETLSAADSPHGTPSFGMRCSENSFTYDLIVGTFEFIEKKIADLFKFGKKN